MGLKSIYVSERSPGSVSQIHRDINTLLSTDYGLAPQIEKPLFEPMMA